MILAEGLLVGAWIIVWGTVFLALQVMARQTFISSSLGVIV